jgi:hypothetical protein
VAVALLHTEVSETRLRLLYLALRFTQGLFDRFQRNLETVRSLFSNGPFDSSHADLLVVALLLETFIHVLGALHEDQLLRTKQSDIWVCPTPMCRLTDLFHANQ